MFNSRFKKDSGTTKAEQEKVKQDYLSWAQRSYEIMKSNINREIENKNISMELLEKKMKKWAGLLPPYAIIVKNTQDLFHGDLRSETLALIETNLYKAFSSILESKR